jgi:hypothetical protein
LNSQMTARVTKRVAISPVILIRIITMAWLTLLIIGSLQPARPSVVKSVHREIHWLGFAVPTILQFIVSRTRRQEVLSAFAIFLVGLSLEVLQHLIYGNGMEWLDVRDNGLAILAAFALYYLTGARKLARAWPRSRSHRKHFDIYHYD